MSRVLVLNVFWLTDRYVAAYSVSAMMIGALGKVYSAMQFREEGTNAQDHRVERPWRLAGQTVQRAIASRAELPSGGN